MICLDTYALIEIHDGNPSYAKLLHEDVVMTDLTLAEFYGVILRRLGEKTAEYWLSKFKPYAESTELDILIEAVRYKQANRKEDLSFFDCVGYVFSVNRRIQFVTGDSAFKGKKGVMFIK